MLLPERMTAITFAAPGGPDVMKLTEVPRPTPGVGEVLIRIAAAGVNRPDIQQRKGLYPPPPGASPILGLEAAGEVVAIGSDVTEWHLGDRVTALCNGGGYAEYCAVPATQCLPWPVGFDAVKAAALPETFFTVWANLFEAGRLAPGERALIHGGASGIGTVAIQLGHAFGATMYATAGTLEKRAACLCLGATAAIDYKTQDFAAEIARLTDGRGVDVILDMVGAPYLARDVRALARDGRLVLIAFQAGSKVEQFDFRPVMTKRLTITGSTMRPRPTAEKGAIAAALAEKVWPLLDAGRVSPVIFASFPFAEAEAAHRLMEEGRHIGKIVLIR
ncbi:MAG TPA: NAD(P)H-quinone oxidoreductase [Acetobacteraceae bacterium]|nr:NAD(P)H-quinone oxidoreductase [Acetobacteraceae bacterium]